MINILVKILKIDKINAIINNIKRVRREESIHNILLVYKDLVNLDENKITHKTVL